ncbi:MAG: MBL fold metallo-hydrolase [Woeseiaceae bacterium]
MKTILMLLGTLLLGGQALAQQPESCPPAQGVALQVLGSGGPIADDARASSSYIVWVDGKSRALIDAGGGSFLRFAEAGASFKDLEFIGLSHFHADHSADFVALLKSGVFANRERPLVVAGPGGAQPFPGLHEYLFETLNPDTGTYRYLAGYLDGSGGLPKLQAAEITAEKSRGIDLLPDNDALAVLAQPVPHGIVPAVAFRVEKGDRAFVFSSDQNGSDETYPEFASDASILVMHLPIPEGAGERARQLHAIPSRVGEIAQEAGAERLLLSHFMARSLATLRSCIVSWTCSSVTSRSS